MPDQNKNTANEKNTEIKSSQPKAESKGNKKAQQNEVQEDNSKTLATEDELIFRKSYANQYRGLVKTENKIDKLDERIREIRDLLKPITQIERKRGVKSSLKAGERKYYKALLRKLIRERFIENQHRMAQNKTFRTYTGAELKRNKTALLIEQARSPFYVKKYKDVICTRTKSMLDNVLKNGSSELSQLKRDLMHTTDKQASNHVLSFLKEFSENPFLPTYYSTHKNLNKGYNHFLKELLKEWNNKTSKNYSFKKSEIKLKEVK